MRKLHPAVLIVVITCATAGLALIGALPEPAPSEPIAIRIPAQVWIPLALIGLAGLAWFIRTFRMETLRFLFWTSILAVIFVGGWLGCRITGTTGGALLGAMIMICAEMYFVGWLGTR